MTSALIIVLREVLEAMLIISLLLAAAVNLGISRRWVVAAIVGGIVGAGVYAYFFDFVSDAFEGVGQELTNATSLFGICIALTAFSLLIVSQSRYGADRIPLWTGIVALFGSIGLAIAREGAEIYIYFSGYILSPEPLQPVLTGGALGAGIGFSVGALIYYGLKIINRSTSLFISCLLLVPVAAGMVSQAITYLMQADKLPSQAPLWDSSAWLPENSVLGELLYALFSYEATPTLLHVSFYIVTVMAMLAGMAAVAGKPGNSSSQPVDHI